jgi:hypothetical protein
MWILYLRINQIVQYQWKVDEREINSIENKILFFEEIVRAFTQVVQDNLSFYWGTSRWSPMEIMVGQKLFRFTYILFDSPGSLFRCPTI